MELRKIKKSLLQGRIRITAHARSRMRKRGYTETDIMSCILSGDITNIQWFKKRVCAIVEGSDLDKFPMVVVVGRDEKNPKGYVIVSVFPPIHKKFKRVI